MNRNLAHGATPGTQTAPRRGPPRPPKKTARGSQDGESRNDGDSKAELGMVVTNAKMTWSELLVLNGGGPVGKREELETSLDWSILALKRLAAHQPKISKLDLKLVMDTLRSILDYRLRFPRSDPSDWQLSERAQVALNEVH